MQPDYPDAICSTCGHTYGDERPLLATYEDGQCGWCGEEGVPVTHPRDFGYPRAPWQVDEEQPKPRLPRGKGKKPKLVHINLRITPTSHAYYSQFDNPSKEMREVLEAYAKAFSLPE